MYDQKAQKNTIYTFIYRHLVLTHICMVKIYDKVYCRILGRSVPTMCFMWDVLQTPGTRKITCKTTIYGILVLQVIFLAPGVWWSSSPHIWIIGCSLFKKTEINYNIGIFWKYCQRKFCIHTQHDDCDDQNHHFLNLLFLEQVLKLVQRDWNEGTGIPRLTRFSIARIWITRSFKNCQKNLHNTIL